MRTLLLTSCTGEKKFKPVNMLTLEDFKNENLLRERQEELMKYVTHARDMYTGQQHVQAMKGIDVLRKEFGQDVIDVAILSAGYGIVEELDPVVPYEVTFNTMGKKQIREWGDKLNITNDVNSLLSRYDLVICLLGDKYIQSIELPLKNADSTVIWFASGTSKKLLLEQEHILEFGIKDTTEFSFGSVALKGYLFQLLAKEIVARGEQLLHVIRDEPQHIMELLETYRNKPRVPENTKPVAKSKKKNKPVSNVRQNSLF